MGRRRFNSILICLVIILLPASQLWAQAKGGTSAAKQPPDKYNDAKNHVKQAISLLRQYLAENPSNDNVYFARLQLAALQSIFKTDESIAPVALRGPITWRVITVANRDSDTKITLEIENSSEAEAKMESFNVAPLIIVANRTTYVMKKGNIPAPRNVGVDELGWCTQCWVLQPSQAARIDVYFEALDEGVTEGLVKRAKSSDEKPARFNLLNVNQVSEADRE